MKKKLLCRVLLTLSVTLLAAATGRFAAADLPFDKLGLLLRGTPPDVPCPQSCDQCDHETCVERVPVTECISGKKLVYDVKKCNEYVAIPETRYRWKMRWVVKEVKCAYCMPTCKTETVDHCYESERWDTQGLGCGKLHCKTCEVKVEKLPGKHCGRKPGETTVKVRYLTCVKEPYTVYRQVAKPVCVKQPRYEHAEVSVTRYICRRCGGGGCGHGSCPKCDPGSCEHGCK